MAEESTDDVLQGSLRDFPLSALLRTLSERVQTGALSLEGGGEIWFSEGRIYLATTPTGASVGAVLFGADDTSMSEIETVFASEEAEGSALDQILGARPKAEASVRRLLHEYNLNSLFELLSTDDLDFSFEPGRRHKLGDRLAVETPELLAQAEQRLGVWRQIAARIPSTATVLRMAPELPSGDFERSITAEDWRYLALVDGHRTVSQITTEIGESTFRVCSTLYRLMLQNLVTETPNEASTDPSAELQPVHRREAWETRPPGIEVAPPQEKLAGVDQAVAQLAQPPAPQ